MREALIRNPKLLVLFKPQCGVATRTLLVKAHWPGQPFPHAGRVRLPGSGSLTRFRSVTGFGSVTGFWRISGFRESFSVREMDVGGIEPSFQRRRPLQRPNCRRGDRTSPGAPRCPFISCPGRPGPFPVVPPVPEPPARLPQPQLRK